MGENDDMSMQQQQQQVQESAFKTEEALLDKQSHMDQSFLHQAQKESTSERDILEKKLEKSDAALTMDQIKTTERAAATDPDDDETGYNKDFMKTDIAFSKLPPEPPQNPRAAIKTASKLIGK